MKKLNLKFNANGLFALLTCALISSNTIAQDNVGIGTNTPDASAILELLSTNKGMLVPRMNANQRLAIASPANALLVYDTDTMCYFYYRQPTTSWVNLCKGGATGATGPAGANGATGPTGPVGPTGSFNNNAWLITGNSGTTAGTNYIGTNDAQDWIIKTGGTGATNERARVSATGNFVVNNTASASASTDVFSAFGFGYPGAINTNPSFEYPIVGYSAGTATGTYGQNIGTGSGAYGENYNATAALPANTTGYGVYGYSNRVPSGTGLSAGVLGYMDPSVTNSAVHGVMGTSSSQIGTGVYGYNAATSGNAYGMLGVTNSAKIGSGVRGVNNANLTVATDEAYGVRGSVGGTLVASAMSAGVRGDAQQMTLPVGSNTYGVYGRASGNTTGSTFGVAGIGTSTIGPAVFGYNINALGTGVHGSANGTGWYTLIGRGSGVSGDGLQYGVSGSATTINLLTSPTNSALAAGANASAGGYFQVGTQTAGVFTAFGWSYVACNSGGAYRKIIGSGTVNTIVKDLEDNYVALSAPEAPENLFQDYGAGQLVNGRAHIDLDPILSKNIRVNSKHPLRVFVQLEGDCKGVYVTEKTQNGFDVIELDGGTSNVNFTWSVVANRADEVMPDGSISKYSEERFAAAPGPQKTAVSKETNSGVIKQETVMRQPNIKQLHPKRKNMNQK